MKRTKMSMDTDTRYTSFKDLRAAWGLKPLTKKRTKDAKKLESQRESFCKKHLCRACGNPMTYIGGNQMVCSNPDCLGIKHEREGKDGNIEVSYSPSYELLDDKGAVIAYNIFD